MKAGFYHLVGAERTETYMVGATLAVALASPRNQVDTGSPVQSKQSIPTGREQVPGTLGIGLMTREHLLRYALDR